MPKLKARVDKKTHALLEAASQASAELGIKWMVTGAAGRLMLLESVYELPPGRATMDVDLGVMVASWNEYKRLIERICRDTRFKKDPKQQHRILFEADGQLDLVPFGDIEKNKEIQWPPDGDFAMSVAGFREAYNQAVLVNVENLSVPVVSPFGLMVLKLFAWKERHLTEPNKDAADIAYLLRNSVSILTERALFEEYADLTEVAGFDLEAAASRAFGQKMGKLVEPDTYELLRRILEDELKLESESQLVREVRHNLPAKNEEQVLELLISLQTGFLESRP